jgi:hypothetical protein
VLRFFDRRVRDGLGGERGVVDEDIHLAQFRVGFGENPLDIGGVAGIGGHTEYLPAPGTRGLFDVGQRVI